METIGDEEKTSTVFVTGVFAVEAQAKASAVEVRGLWLDRPKGRVAMDDSERTQLFN